MTRLLLIALLLVHGAIDVGFAQNNIATPSTWVNQRGSILTIQMVANDGVFAGTYVNNAPGTFCIGDPYLVEGKVEADRIRFAVAFADRTDAAKNCLTVTQWRGTVSAKVIDTTWSLAYPGPAGLTVIGGSDRFDLQP